MRRSRTTSTWSPWRRSPTSCRCSGENRALRAPRPARAGRHRQAGPARPDGRRARRSRQARRALGRLRAGAPSERRRAPLSRRRRASSCSSPRIRAARAQDRERARPRQPRAPARSSCASASRPKRRSPRARRPRAAYVLAARAGMPGVIGIVASRLVEPSGRPVVMIALDGERGRARGGASRPFDLLGGARPPAPEHLRALRRPSGRRRARDRAQRAGRGLLARRSSATRSRAPRRPRRSGAGRARGCRRRGRQLGMDARRGAADALAPFGRGNPRVSLMLADATLRRPAPDGAKASTCASPSSPRGSRARAVAFGTGRGCPSRRASRHEATFTLEVNEWNGVSEPRLVLRRRARSRSPRPSSRSAPPVRRGREGSRASALPEHAAGLLQSGGPVPTLWVWRRPRSSSLSRRRIAGPRGCAE